MAHFGVLSHSGTGHLNPLIALSRELVKRGHKVTFFQKPEVESRVRQHHLGFSSIGAARHSSEKPGNPDGRASAQTDSADLRQNLRRILAEVRRSLRELPAALTKAGIEVLIVDEIILSGPTLAQMLDIPYFVVSTSVPLNFGWPTSPRLSGHRIPTSHLSRSLKSFLQVSVSRMHGPVRRRLDEYRRRLGLGPTREIQRKFPALAHITQLPQCLDFPRSRLPRNFYYAGPFVDEDGRPPIEFPWHRLDGRPLVYASFGTARTVQAAIFHFIAEACNELDLQLVISLGGRSGSETFGGLAGQPLVVTDAPQLELLKRAEIVITHGGLNTVMEALMEGKLILAIPIDYDQPAIADRLAWLGAAEVLPAEGLATTRIRKALQKLLSNDDCRNAVVELQGRIRNSGGLKRAADVMEAALEGHAARSGAGLPRQDSHNHEMNPGDTNLECQTETET
jgi:zeaxanthin glucosyltransferase